MNRAKLILIVLALVIGCAWASAQSFHSQREAFRYGYDQGYQSGSADRLAGRDFDFRRDSGSKDTYYSSDDPNFRNGYAEGYTDGFESRGARSEDAYLRYSSDDRDDDSDHDHDEDVDHDERDYYDRDHDEVDARSVPATMGSVRVFTEEKFQGESRDFGVGHYPKLKDDWNDSIESIQISGNVRLILFDKSNFEGQQLIIERNTAELDDLNFDGKAASMIIEPIR